MKLVTTHTSWLARIARLLPFNLCTVEHCRVGTDTVTYCVIDLRFL